MADHGGGGSDIGRRGFLSLVVGLIGTIVGFSYLGVALRFLYPRRTSRAKMQNVGRRDDFALDEPKLVRFTGAGVTDGVFVVRKGGEWLALDFHCTHLQCAVTWYDAAGAFLCPCHGSTFDINGKNLSGPAPTPLRRHAIDVRNDGVYVGGLIT